MNPLRVADYREIIDRDGDHWLYDWDQRAFRMIRNTAFHSVGASVTDIDENYGPIRRSAPNMVILHVFLRGGSRRQFHGSTVPEAWQSACNYRMNTIKHIDYLELITVHRAINPWPLDFHTAERNA